VLCVKAIELAANVLCVKAIELVANEPERRHTPELAATISADRQPLAGTPDHAALVDPGDVVSRGT